MNRLAVGLASFLLTVCVYAGTGNNARTGNPGTGNGTVTSVSSPNGTITVGSGTTAATVDVVYGTAANTAAQGNDSRVVNAVPNTTTVNGHALSSNVTVTNADLGAAPISSLDLIVYGSGTDGNVTLAGGTTTLVRDMYYNNLTFAATSVVNTAGFRVFVIGTCDASAANNNAQIFQNNGNAGNNAASATGGANPSALATSMLPSAHVGSTAGGNGTTGAGTAATATAITSIRMIGGVGGTSGAGGAGVSGGGAGASTTGSAQAMQLMRPFWDAPILMSPSNGFYTSNGSTINTFYSSEAGSGGGGGGGDATNAGGGGGGAGGGGGFVWVACKTFVKPASNTVKISAVGGVGGNGFSTAAGNTGGGGGGSGGNGGAIRFIYDTISGAGSLILDASGGTGGAGGTKTGTGTNGSGGGGGYGGSLIVYNMGGGTTTAQVPTFSLSSVNYSTGYGSPGAAGGVGVTTAGTGAANTVTL